MQKLEKLYEKLWKALIMPDRYEYQLEDIGPYAVNQPMVSDPSVDITFIKKDFILRTALGHKIGVTTYLPEDE